MNKSPHLVLAIDDDPMFLKSLEVTLSKVAIEVRTTTLSETFYNQIEKLKPSLVLVDLQIDQVSGLDVIRHIRAKDEKTPILVISSQNSTEIISEALKAGANDFALKPLDRTLLISKLSRFIDHKELKNYCAEYLEIPQGRLQAKLIMDGAIHEIDEMGIRFSNRNFFPKGTMIKLKSNVFSEILGDRYDQDCEIILTISSQWFDLEGQTYVNYAEFDATDTSLLQGISQWLMRFQKREP